MSKDRSDIAIQLTVEILRLNPGCASDPFNEETHQKVVNIYKSIREKLEKSQDKFVHQSGPIV